MGEKIRLQRFKLAAFVCINLDCANYSHGKTQYKTLRSTH